MERIWIFYPDKSFHSQPEKVKDTTVFPYNTIGCLVSTFPNGEKYWGTGTLLGPYTVSTAAQMLYDSSKGGEAVSVEFSPGQYQHGPGGEIIRPYGTKTSSNIEVSYPYTQNEIYQNYASAAVHFEEPFEGISDFIPVHYNINSFDYYIYAGYTAIEENGLISYTMWESKGELSAHWS